MLDLELFSRLSPGQFQDYVTCPLLYKLKHVDKRIHPTDGVAYLTIILNKTLENYFNSNLISPCKKGSVKSRSEFCQISFTELFLSSLEKYKTLNKIDWKDKTEAYYLDLGQRLFHKMLENHIFRNMDVKHSELTIPIYLIPDPVNQTFIQSCIKTSRCFTYECRVDGITTNNTLLNFSTSNCRMADGNVTSLAKYGFYDLALHQMLGCPQDHSSKLLSFFFIRAKENPRIQVIEFHKTKNNREFSLQHFYKIQMKIQNNQFEPNQNNLCQKHCHFRSECGHFSTKMGNI